MRLLYVDDDRVNTLLFENACAGIDGLQLQTAASGAEAIDSVAEQAPAAVVIDLHLPDTDGFALLAELRTRCGRPGLPAVLCSAEAAHDIRAQALQAGFQHCWEKPVSAPVVSGWWHSLGLRGR